MTFDDAFDSAAKLHLSNGDTVLIKLNQQVVSDDPIDNQGDRLLANGGAFLRRAMEQIKGVGEDMADAMLQISPAPKEVSVTFGIDLSTETGIVIAKTGVAANFNVTITWGGKQ